MRTLSDRSPYDYMHVKPVGYRVGRPFSARHWLRLMNTATLVIEIYTAALNDYKCKMGNAAPPFQSRWLIAALNCGDEAV